MKGETVQFQQLYISSSIMRLAGIAPFSGIDKVFAPGMVQSEIVPLFSV
jgi:hypothetical protein